MEFAKEVMVAPPDETAEYPVGRIVRVYAGAPGTGHVDYEVTRHDAKAVWGVERVNTIRILEPWEVV